MPALNYAAGKWFWNRHCLRSPRNSPESSFTNCSTSSGSAREMFYGVLTKTISSSNSVAAPVGSWAGRPNGEKPRLSCGTGAYVAAAGGNMFAKAFVTPLHGPPAASEYMTNLPSHPVSAPRVAAGSMRYSSWRTWRAEQGHVCAPLKKVLMPGALPDIIKRASAQALFFGGRIGRTVCTVA